MFLHWLFLVGGSLGFVEGLLQEDGPMLVDTYSLNQWIFQDLVKGGR